MASSFIVDPVETIRGEVMRKIVNAGIFTLDQIQRENSMAPETVPYCRISIAQGAEFQADSQTIQSKTVIAEVDIFVNARTQTQYAGQLAAMVEDCFGLFDQSSEKRNIPMPGWTGTVAVVSKFGRGSATEESEVNLYRLPVLLYVKITLKAGAKYAL